jgi:hypothetical protein
LIIWATTTASRPALRLAADVPAPALRPDKLALDVEAPAFIPDEEGTLTLAFLPDEAEKKAEQLSLMTNFYLINSNEE